MAEAGVCKCGFEGRAAVAGYARMVLASAMVVTTAMAAGAAALDPRPAEYETIVPFVFWAILALTLATDVAAVWANVRLADCSRGAHLTATGAWPWLFLLIVFSAVPVLFAAGPSMPAVVLEIYLLGRIVIEGTFAGHRAGMFADSDPDTLDPEVTLRCMRTAIRYAGFGLVTILFATTWVAAGTAPSWAERTILTALWIIVSALLFGEACLVWRDMVGDYLPSRHDDPGPSFLDKPRTGLEELPLMTVSWAGWWLGNAGMILLIYELSLAGQTALAALWVLQILMAWALNTERRLRAAGDRRGEIGRPYLALHAAVRDIARALHLAVATPVQAARRLLGRMT
jgi:hypothetical protein